MSQPSDNEPASKPRHNVLFETFVDPAKENEDQLESLVAYALYKKAKREWTADICRSAGQPPTEQQRADYARTWSETVIEATREKAKAAMAAYADVAIESATPDILREATRGSFLKSLGASILAAFFYSLILLSVVLILKYYGVDILGLVQKLGKP